MGSIGEKQPPPEYEAVAPSGTGSAPSADLSALFSGLKLGTEPEGPGPSTCIAHLKLLFALETLKEDIGYSDGLWSLWNSRIDGHELVQTPGGEEEERRMSSEDIDIAKKDRDFLSRIREKRWALFVARAVDRYEAWWNSMVDASPVKDDDRDSDDSTAYVNFPKDQMQRFWTADILPPLGKPYLCSNVSYFFLTRAKMSSWSCTLTC